MLTRNRPTPEGQALGEQLARFADTADASIRAEDPAWPERCTTCAFRLGTIPNGCPTTVMDALKCVTEHIEFQCHERKPEHPCMGWASLVKTSASAPVKAFWPFSDETQEESTT